MRRARKQIPSSKRFGNVHPGETPSPFRRTTTSNAIPRLTRLTPKRSFASRIRPQSAALTLGTRVKLGIDLAQSWMIGDRWRDIDCGAAAGCRTIFIDHGYDEPLRSAPDFRAASLRAAVPVLLGAGCSVFIFRT